MSIIHFESKLFKSLIHLPKEQLGEAFAALLEYAETGQRKSLEDPVTNLTYTIMADAVNEFWINQDKRKITSRENGKLGGRPRKQPNKNL